MPGRRILTVCLLLATAAAPPQNGEREVVVANRSARTINEVYASPTHSDDWGPDRLGDATLEPGQSQHIGLGAGSGHECLFDVQIVYHDASREERRAVDLCRTHLLVFDATRATAPAAVTQEQPVVIANQSALPIQQVLISPAEAGDWGDDRLGQTSISVGDTARIAYRGDCLADLRVVFENRSAEERRGLDLCSLHGITIKPGWTTAAAPEPPGDTRDLPVSVTVLNHAGHAIDELYLYPAASPDPGPERLGASPLEDGSQTVVDLRRPPGTCRYSARVVYGGKRAAQNLSGLDLCHQTQLVVPPRS